MRSLKNAFSLLTSDDPSRSSDDRPVGIDCAPGARKGIRSLVSGSANWTAAASLRSPLVKRRSFFPRRCNRRWIGAPRFSDDRIRSSSSIDRESPANANLRNLQVRKQFRKFLAIFYGEEWICQAESRGRDSQEETHDLLLWDARASTKVRNYSRRRERVFFSFPLLPHPSSPLPSTPGPTAKRRKENTGRKRTGKGNNYARECVFSVPPAPRSPLPPPPQYPPGISAYELAVRSAVSVFFMGVPLRASCRCRIKSQSRSARASWPWQLDQSRQFVNPAKVLTEQSTAK